MNSQKIKLKKHLGTTPKVEVKVVEGKKTVGQGFLYLIYNGQRRGFYALLGDVFIDPKYRSHGLGTRLVKELIKIAKAEKCYKLVATSRLENEGLHKWYQKLGFKNYGIEFRMDFKKNGKKPVCNFSRG